MLSENFSNEELLEIRKKHKEKLALEQQETEELYKAKIEKEKKEEAERLAEMIKELATNSLFVFNECLQKFILTDDKKFVIEVNASKIYSSIISNVELSNKIPLLTHEALIKKVNDAYPKLKFVSYVQDDLKLGKFSIAFKPILHNITPCDIISESVPRWKSIHSLPLSGDVWVCYVKYDGEISIENIKSDDLKSQIVKLDLQPILWLQVSNFYKKVLACLGVALWLATLYTIYVTKIGAWAIFAFPIFLIGCVYYLNISNAPSKEDLKKYFNSTEYLANKEVVSWYDEVPKEFVLDVKTAKRKAEMEYKNMIAQA